MVDPRRNTRPRSAAIKGALPRSFLPHHLSPLFSLDLLHLLHLDIVHKSPSISSPEPVSHRRSSPEIDAIPGDAAGTRRTAVDDNVPAHLADDLRSAGELADPLPAPPVHAPLAVDDDELDPLDRVLIVRLRKELTVSRLMSH
jgi:hypothetical protein